MKWLVLLLVLSASLGAGAVHAKRLGHADTEGKLAGATAQRADAPAGMPGDAVSMPGVSGALVGLAAGLGLAGGLSAGGQGASVAVLLLGLVALACGGLGWWWYRRTRARRANTAAWSGASGWVYQGSAGRSPREYSPQNVGNDASARPWERSVSGFEPSRFGEMAVGGGALTGSGLAQLPAWGIPDGFDVAGFLDASKANFVALQAAWDRADIPSLRAMMTDEMLTQIKAQLAEREQHSGTVTNVTEVVMLEARLLGIEELTHAYMASVEFSGMIREEAAAGPNPFREVWNITRPKSGSAGWLVAGVQALQ